VARGDASGGAGARDTHLHGPRHPDGELGGVANQSLSSRGKVGNVFRALVQMTLARVIRVTLIREFVRWPSPTRVILISLTALITLMLGADACAAAGAAQGSASGFELPSFWFQSASE
jgi:hypothetical protein